MCCQNQAGKAAISGSIEKGLTLQLFPFSLWLLYLPKASLGTTEFGEIAEAAVGIILLNNCLHFDLMSIKSFHLNKIASKVSIHL